MQESFSVMTWVGDSFVASLKLSVVASSTMARDERSARAQMTPDVVSTSPDCSPWVTMGRLEA